MRCFSLTQQGHRCKRHGTQVKNEDGFLIHTCKQHDRKNCTNDWKEVILDELYIPSSLPLVFERMMSMMLYMYMNYGWDKHICKVIVDYTWLDFLHLDFTPNLELCYKQVDIVFIKRFIQKNFEYEAFGREECPICYETFDNNIKTICGHVFCKKCITKSLYNSIRCPMCRNELLDISCLKSN